MMIRHNVALALDGIVDWTGLDWWHGTGIDRINWQIEFVTHFAIIVGRRSVVAHLQGSSEDGVPEPTLLTGSEYFNWLIGQGVNYKDRTQFVCTPRHCLLLYVLSCPAASASDLDDDDGPTIIISAGRGCITGIVVMLVGVRYKGGGKQVQCVVWVGEGENLQVTPFSRSS